MRGKRGEGLPLNVIIVAIIAVVVLVVLVAFFLGGATGLTRTIKTIFFGTTAGTDKVIAVETCRTRCDQALSLPEGLRQKSAFCTSPFNIDINGDGEAEVVTSGDKKVYKKFYCNGNLLMVSCPQVDDKCETQDDS